MPSHSGIETLANPAARNTSAGHGADSHRATVRGTPGPTTKGSAHNTVVDAHKGGTHSRVANSPDPNRASDTYRLAHPVAKLF